MVKTGREEHLNIPPATGNSRFLPEVFQAIEQLQKGLEDEVQVACKRTMKKVTEE